MAVAAGEVIPGWEVAVKSMRRNERSQFLISPDYAFGKIGCPPRIPPNATSESGISPSLYLREWREFLACEWRLCGLDLVLCVNE